MAYQVDFTPPTRNLARADVTFRVRHNRRTLGTLEVSQGAVVWYPRNAQYGQKLIWQRFANLMQENGLRVEKR